MEGQEESHSNSSGSNDNKSAKDKKGGNNRATKTIPKHRGTGSANDTTATGTRKGSRSAGRTAQVCAVEHHHMQPLGLSPPAMRNPPPLRAIAHKVYSSCLTNNSRTATHAPLPSRRAFILRPSQDSGLIIPVSASCQCSPHASCVMRQLLYTLFFYLCLPYISIKHVLNFYFTG